MKKLLMITLMVFAWSSCRTVPNSEIAATTATAETTSPAADNPKNVYESDPERLAFMEKCVHPDYGKTRKKVDNLRFVARQVWGRVKRSKFKPFGKRGLIEDAYYTTKKHYTDFLARPDVVKALQSRQPVGDIASADFRKEMEIAASTKFTVGNGYRLHPGADSAQELRQSWIRGAKKNIWILVWAFYEDEGGCSTAWDLVQKQREGVDVRVVVDGLTARHIHHRVPTQFLEDNGVKIVKWRKGQTLYGMHRKILIVDGEKAITGGRNYGDYYLHTGGVEGKDRWLDFDIEMSGPTVEQVSAVFFLAWNRYHRRVGEEKKLLDKDKVKMDASPVDQANPNATGTALAWVDHDPASRKFDPILYSTIRAIYAAKRSIKINNAYYISSVMLDQALKDAADRGVEIKLYTNSVESIDVAQIMNPINKSVNKLLSLPGSAACVRKGSTTHSKYLVIDGVVGWVGSYNIQPRSIVFESEAVVMFHDKTLGGDLEAEFDREFDDPNSCKKYTSGQFLKVPDAGVPEWFGNYMRDTL